MDGKDFTFHKLQHRTKDHVVYGRWPVSKPKSDLGNYTVTEITEDEYKQAMGHAERRVRYQAEWPQATERDLDIMLEREDSGLNILDRSDPLAEAEDNADDDEE